MTKPQPKGLAVAPLYWQPVRWFGVLAVSAYYRSAYHIRGWGNFPVRRGPTLIVVNHQHDIESAIIVATLSIAGLAWRYPIFTVSSRRMWEPDFMAQRIPWIRPFVRGLNFGSLYSALGMQPIENELHSKPLLSMAYMLYRQHGDRALRDVFRERVTIRLPADLTHLAEVWKPAFSQAASLVVSLSDLREPYRSEAIADTREQLENDSAHFEQLVRDGASLFLAPEGFYSIDGKMQRMRGLLPRLAPLARIWLAGISYDPFLGRRLSMLYRLAPDDRQSPLDVQLKRLRPVTVSALLATWLRAQSSPFTEAGAVETVLRQLHDLPVALFVEPELRRRPAHLVRAALRRMQALGILTRQPDGWHLSQERTHPQFSRTSDILEYQANFHAETLAGAGYAAATSARG